MRAGKLVYFVALADLVAQLAKAEREGSLRERIRFLCRASLLVVDEIGYLPVTPGGGNLFFQLVNARYEKGAMILTSNRGFAEWGDIFGSPSSPPHCSTACSTMPSSSRSRDRATACASTPLSSQKTSAPMPPSTQTHQNAAGAPPQNNQSASKMRDYQPHTVRRTAEYSAPTFKENSAPFHNLGAAIMAVAANGDVSARPVAPDHPQQASQMTAYLLP